MLKSGERERRRRNLEAAAAAAIGCSGRRCLLRPRAVSSGEEGRGRRRCRRRWSNRRCEDEAVRTLLVREFRPTSADGHEERRRGIRGERSRDEEEAAFIRRCLNYERDGDIDSDDSGEASEDTELVKRYLDEVLLLLQRHRSRDRALKRSRSCDSVMLAPPVLLTTPDGGTGEVTTRRNSCVSDGVPGPATAAAASPFLLRATPAGSRRASALSASGIAAVAAAAAKTNSAAGGGGGRKAFLLRQRSTGEEVVVTMAALGSPVKGARAVVSQVPTFVTRGSSRGAQSRKTSFDDHQVSYDSLMTPADYSRRFSEMVHSQDVLLQNHLEKIYQKFRSSRGSSEDLDAEMAPVPAPPVRKRREDRLDDWLTEMESRKRRPSCALGEFGRQAAASAKGPIPMAAAGKRHLTAATSTKSLPKSPQRERLYRSSSHAGAAGLNIPAPSSAAALGLRRGSHCPLGRAASSDVPHRGSFKRGGSRRQHRRGSSKEIPLMRIRQAHPSHLLPRPSRAFFWVSQSSTGKVLAGK